MQQIGEKEEDLGPDVGDLVGFFMGDKEREAVTDYGIVVSITSYDSKQNIPKAVINYMVDVFIISKGEVKSVWTSRYPGRRTYDFPCRKYFLRRKISHNRHVV